MDGNMFWKLIYWPYFHLILLEQKRNFKINVRLIIQKAAMYQTFQFIDIYDVH